MVDSCLALNWKLNYENTPTTLSINWTLGSHPKKVHKLRQWPYLLSSGSSKSSKTSRRDLEDRWSLDRVPDVELHENFTEASEA